MLGNVRRNRRNLTFAMPLTEASIYARFEGLEVIAISATTGINKRSARGIRFIEIESLVIPYRAGAAVDWFFADRCYTVIRKSYSSG